MCRNLKQVPSEYCAERYHYTKLLGAAEFLGFLQKVLPRNHRGECVSSCPYYILSYNVPWQLPATHHTNETLSY